MTMKRYFNAPLLGSAKPKTRDSTVIEYWGHNYRPGSGWSDLSGNGHDLTEVGSPVWVNSDFQLPDGNHLRAVSGNAGANYFSVSHHADFNMFSSSFTLTAALMRPSTSSGTESIFDHASATDGFVLYSPGATTVNARFIGSSVTKDVQATVNKDDMYHILHVVRDGDFARFDVDGSIGTWVDVSGFGLDVSTILYLMSDSANHFDGHLSYFRLDAEALSEAELKHDLQMLCGAGIAPIGDIKPYWDFGRTTKGTIQHSTDREPVTIAPNLPRVGGPGGGLLMEAGKTNLIDDPDDLTQTSWSKVGSSAPSAKVFHEDTSTGTHYMSDSLDYTTGQKYVFESMVTSINRDLVFYAGYDSSGYWQACFDVSNGTVLVENGCEARVEPAGIGPNGSPRYRCIATYTATATGSGYVRFYATTGSTWPTDATFIGLDQDTFYIEAINFGTGLPGSHVQDSARTKDQCKIPISRTCVPEKIGNSYQDKKLTIEFDMICPWANKDWLPQTQYLIELSGTSGTGTANRIFIIYNTDGKIDCWIRDSDDNDHFARSPADSVVWSYWNHVKFYIDFADMSNLDLWINGSNASNTYNGNSGSCDLIATGTWIIIAKRYDLTNDSSIKIKNLRILAGD